ncbi:hypothetical protein [Shewanella algae]|uniref:hypothetical protein n=1 Tax=Shewanella algae TaxID=38313 RepID=UPI001AAD138F|nr:hypothetical protein [Shewanella algae]MBO2558975.1 hypothetical protein [Shewanella algae]MBO2575872.1 hypothetical protein [Shewanella algae]
MELPKFNNQFFGGLFTGAALATMLVGTMAQNQVKKNSDVAERYMDITLAATKDIGSLKRQCGESCDGIHLTYIDYLYKNRQEITE